MLADWVKVITKSIGPIVIFWSCLRYCWVIFIFVGFDQWFMTMEENSMTDSWALLSFSCHSLVAIIPIIITWTYVAPFKIPEDVLHRSSRIKQLIIIKHGWRPQALLSKYDFRSFYAMQYLCSVFTGWKECRIQISWSGFWFAHTFTCTMKSLGGFGMVGIFTDLDSDQWGMESF